jgi:hypothetical protein
MPLNPRNTPQRTKDHVLADLSANYVERLFLKEMRRTKQEVVRDAIQAIDHQD